MLTQEIAYNRQVTLWRMLGSDGFGGDKVGAPEIIWVRWENDVSRKIEGVYKAAGESVLANAIVWSADKLSQGDWLYCGVSAETDPKRAGTRRGMDKAFAVGRVTEVPSVKGDQEEYVSYL